MWTWFSNFFEKALVRRVKRRFAMRIVRLARSMCEVLTCAGSGLSAPCVSHWKDDGLASSEPQISVVRRRLRRHEFPPARSPLVTPSPRKMNVGLHRLSPFKVGRRRYAYPTLTQDDLAGVMGGTPDSSCDLRCTPKFSVLAGADLQGPSRCHPWAKPRVHPDVHVASACRTRHRSTA